MSERQAFMAAIKRMWLNLGRPEASWDAVHDWDYYFRQRGLEMSTIDSHCRESVSEAFDIAEAMAAEIVYENDEHPGNYEMQPDGRGKWVAETPEHRWHRMRKWVESNIKQVTP